MWHEEKAQVTTTSHACHTWIPSPSPAKRKLAHGKLGQGAGSTEITVCVSFQETLIIIQPKVEQGTKNPAWTLEFWFKTGTLSVWVKRFFLFYFCLVLVLLSVCFLRALWNGWAVNHAALWLVSVGAMLQSYSACRCYHLVWIKIL